MKFSERVDEIATKMRDECEEQEKRALSYIEQVMLLCVAISQAADEAGITIEPLK